MTQQKRYPMAFAMAALAATTALIAHAQTAAPAAEAQSAQWNTLWDYWKVGGFAMYPIGLCSVGVVALSVYCWMQYRTVKMNQPELVPLLKEAAGRHDIVQALSICNSAPGILTSILGAGLRRIGDSPVEVGSIEKAMEEASIEEVNTGMKPLAYLSVLSQVAPMFGLLGTVTGMIGAFNKIGMGSMGDPEKLAANIGEAMITTAAGLLVAIPAMFAYFGFKTHYTSNISRISRILGDIVHLLGEPPKASGAEEASNARVL